MEKNEMRVKYEITQRLQKEYLKAGKDAKKSRTAVIKIPADLIDSDFFCVSLAGTIRSKDGFITSSAGFITSLGTDDEKWENIRVNSLSRYTDDRWSVKADKDAEFLIDTDLSEKELESELIRQLRTQLKSVEQVKEEHREEIEQIEEAKTKREREEREREERKKEKERARELFREEIEKIEKERAEWQRKAEKNREEIEKDIVNNGYIEIYEEELKRYNLEED